MPNQIVYFPRPHWVNSEAHHELEKNPDAPSSVDVLVKEIAINGERRLARACRDFPQIHVQLRILG